MSTQTFVCTRDFFDGCLGSVTLEEDQLITQEDGTVTPVPPDASDTERVDWIGDPESDGIICRVCATEGELEDHEHDLQRFP